MHLKRKSESIVKVANDRDILPDLTDYSSGLSHYLNQRFPIGLLAIIAARRYAFQG